MSRNPQETHLNRARASLRQALSWYSNLRKSSKTASNSRLVGLVKPEVEMLTSTLNKLDFNMIRIAAFGLVSRGKSAVLNALLGEKMLQTGALNGVTQYPRSVRWNPGGKVQVELIDTPGLDEIEGEARAKMARQVARQADLILFVVSGDITRTEYRALCELRRAQKPLILVFNKIDLYPDTDRQKIYRNLQQLGRANPQSQPLQPEEIVMVAAEPAPMEVRVEFPDGTVDYEWETPAPQIEELKQVILQILNREGRSLLALNALIQARDASANIAAKTMEIRTERAEDLIWQFTKYKALAVALNPIAVLDVLGGLMADLALIRSLSRLYGLPMTGYEAGKLLKTILASSGGLLLSEVGSNLLLGLNKSTVAIASGDNPANITGYAGTAVTQAGIAGYGSYAIGKAAQVYLEKGCTWGELGSSSVIAEILAEVEPNTILYRFRQELYLQNRYSSSQEN
ncbi:MAG: DUF697 domain-containing protein [Richelia sp.]|nr:DUF697 domain-containing protein [Richelia sp.]CDN11655.1 FIG00873807: hypothetical protein [Richelia intracellularis]